MSLVSLGAYGLLLSALFAAPFLARLGIVAGWSLNRRWHDGALALVLAAATALTFFRDQPTLLLGAALAIALFRRNRVVLGIVLALLLFAPAVWWIADDRVRWLDFVAALAGGVIAFWLAPNEPRNDDRRGGRLAPAMALAFAIGLLIGLPTAPFADSYSATTAWHHWGAYLAPVEAWLSGGSPWRDFPVQYGLGPTTILAASCAGDCWRGLYWVTVVANAAYFSVLAGCVAIVTDRSAAGFRALAFAALTCAVFAWTAFPFQAATAVITPSVGGLRFLPLALVLLCALLDIKGRLRSDWIGHAAWLTGLLSSPEAAGFTTLVWWPYLAARDAGTAVDRRGAFKALARQLARFAGLLAAGLSVLAGIVWALSAGEGGAQDFFLYLLHPPGPLPINPLGPIWLALFSVVVATVAIGRETEPATRLRVFVAALAFMAGGTYYLSRSHDNNVLNLFALLVPLLAALGDWLGRRNARVSDAWRGFTAGTLAAMAVFVITFSGEAWRVAAADGALARIGPSQLIARFSSHAGRAPPLLPPNAAQALARVPAARPSFIATARA